MIRIWAAQPFASNEDAEDWAARYLYELGAVETHTYTVRVSPSVRAGFPSPEYADSSLLVPQKYSLLKILLQ
jgi:hypothetical protein